MIDAGTELIFTLMKEVKMMIQLCYVGFVFGLVVSFDAAEVLNLRLCLFSMPTHDTFHFGVVICSVKNNTVQTVESEANKVENIGSFDMMPKFKYVRVS